MPPRDLAALPKAHLHLHVEAAIRETTLREMAAELDLPKLRSFTGFTEFNLTYRTMLTVLSVPENLARLFDEVLADAKVQGAVYAELGVMPALYLTTFGTHRDALEFTIEAARAAQRKHNVAVGLMMTIDRVLDVNAAIETATLAAEYADRGVVALGLANEERGRPAEKFEPAYAIGREAGLLSTPHAGELVGPESVRGALDSLGADRLGHGVRSVEDPELVARLAAEGICCDVCPTSNVLLDVAPSLAGHQLPALLDAGVPCSINADDPVLFQTNLLHEYELCRSAMDLNDEQLAACARASIAHSGAPNDVKHAALAGIDAWLADS